MPRHFLTLTDFTPEAIRETLDLAKRLKLETRRGVPHPLLEGQSIAAIFHKPSLRTKVSFEVAMVQLGGHAVNLTRDEIGLGSREAVRDVAQVLSRYVQGIVIRTFSQELVEELAQWSRVPVINALTDLYHPCQVLADLFTIQEVRGQLDGTRVAYLGDGNNVCHSWLSAAMRIPLELRLGIGAGYDPDPQIVERAEQAGVSRIRIFRDPHEAVAGAQVIYTDVWTSMGQEQEQERRKRDLAGYQLNAALVAGADSHAIIMHCLPAHRGEEITDDVIDSEQSVVFPQAENRLHAQKALLASLLGGGA